MKILFYILMFSMGLTNSSVTAADSIDVATKEAGNASSEETEFANEIQPLLKEFCVRCHNPDNLKSGVRVDHLTASPEDKQLFLLNGMLKQIENRAMPPEDEPQMSDQQRNRLTNWITRTIKIARSRDVARNGSVRRLTVAQYRNTLRDLLGLEENLTEILPPDAVSKDGFLNNSQTMLLSPMQIESYFNIAEKALDLCIVDEKAKPVIQNFRVELGRSINPQPCPDKLILGANSLLLDNSGVIVTELKPSKSFDFQPFAMRTHYDFIEGYVGNDTIREWKSFDSIYHSVFACMRGTPGYPKGEAYRTVPEGLLLRPAIPSPEIFGQSDTYGPMANFKVSLRELPDEGNFKITVKAARYDDGLLLESGIQPAVSESSVAISLDSQSPAVAQIAEAGIYQVDVVSLPVYKPGVLTLDLGHRSFSAHLLEGQFIAPATNNVNPAEEKTTAFLVVRLQPGDLSLSVQQKDPSKLRRVVFTKLSPDSDLAKRFTVFETRKPSVGVYIGLRRDCGSTMNPVNAPLVVESNEVQDFVFTGAIKNYPNPDVEKDNVNYLAGVREIGVRSEYTDGRDMPRLLIRSVEFEGPYYESWPPETHRRIFLESSQRNDPQAYAREVIGSFATRAFRRPLTTIELDALISVWQKSFDATGNFQQSIKDTLLVVLTSPQFLFLIEQSSTAEAEDLDAYELASKLSYTFWNTSPDNQLLELASENRLHQSLDTEIDRLLNDSRSAQFISEFVSQWLSLDKFDVVSVDAKRFPRLTRDAKLRLRREPIEYVKFAIAENLPIRNLIQSNFIVADEIVASYYNLGDRIETGFRFVPVVHGEESLGGLLTEAAILSGLSDGRESNPIKRGAWMARKIVAEPPDDPPPNVPRIKDDDGTQLSLREKLDQHRNQQGCAKCHSGIDPWGLPFEQYDAAGLLKKKIDIDSRAKLPDGTEVKNVRDLKAYLSKDRIDQVAYSFLKHFACYATGRSLTYNEIAYLHERGLELKPGEYRMRDLLRFIIKSDLFLKK